MNKLHIIIAGLILAILSISSCKEIGPDINLGGSQNSVSDTTYIESPVATPEIKNILIEDFTGVRCPNCPQAHVIIQSLKTQYPNRIVAVSLHPINTLGAPYVFSPQNFDNQKAQNLFDYLGQIGFEPAGGIDRKLYTGESNVLVDKSTWNTHVGDELPLVPPVNITLTKMYDSTSRQLTITAELHYTTTDTTSNRLTIMLTESNIVNPQLNGSVIDTFYVHKDVLRDVITTTQGDALTAPRQAGRVVRKTYKTTLDTGWKPENMSIVAFVHEYVNTKVVYQAKEISVE